MENKAEINLAERKKDLLKEIDLIQAVISRMSNTSFIIKGWTVTMTTYLFASKSDEYTLILVFLPILLFWFLDAYFLQHERLFRKLYQWVVQNRMTDDSDLFSLNIGRFQHEKSPIVAVMFSFTLFIFYGGAIALVIAYFSFRQYLI